MPRKRVGKPLTQRQRELIRTVRAARSERIARDEMAKTFTEGGSELGPEVEGRVVAHFAYNVEVENSEGARFRCSVRETLEDEPICGDWVRWRPSGDAQGVIVAVGERQTILRRPGPYNRLLSVAANVDRIVVVTASGMLNPGLMDRYLAASQQADIEPILVVNKSDQLLDSAEEDAILAPYLQMGYAVFRVSVLQGEALAPLEAALRDRCAVLVGESGVGKSSLVKYWLQDVFIKTAEVHPGTGKGRHATTTAQLYRLPWGGVLIDSPGVREFGLHGVVRESLPGLFRDMEPFLGRCRFSDCRHQQEPNCALRQAVSVGEVSPLRLASMLRIMDSLPSRYAY